MRMPQPTISIRDLRQLCAIPNLLTSLSFSLLLSVHVVPEHAIAPAIARHNAVSAAHTVDVASDFQISDLAHVHFSFLFLIFNRHKPHHEAKSKRPDQ